MTRTMASSSRFVEVENLHFLNAYKFIIVPYGIKGFLLASSIISYNFDQL